MTDLNPGERAKGLIAFQVPAQAKLEGVKYEMSSAVTLETGLTK